MLQFFMSDDKSADWLPTLWANPICEKLIKMFEKHSKIFFFECSINLRELRIPLCLVDHNNLFSLMTQIDLLFATWMNNSNYNHNIDLKICIKFICKTKKIYLTINFEMFCNLFQYIFDLNFDLFAAHPLLMKKFE